MWKWVLSILLLATPVSAQVVVNAPIYPGVVTIALLDTAVLAAAGADTSEAFLVGAVDLAGLFVKYDNRKDSINVVTLLDISPDGDDAHWTLWGGLDTALVSGTADSTTHKRVLNFPDWPAFGRVRHQAAAAAGDTVKITTRITLVRISVDRL